MSTSEGTRHTGGGGGLPGQVARRTLDGELIEWLDVPSRAALLNLEPHPEGGWFRRTWTASAAAVTADGTERPAASLIYFLLPPGEMSAWHRVDFEEIWLWHGPDAVMFQLGGDGDAPAFSGEHARIITLGGSLENDAHPQIVVPARVWQRTLPGDGETLVSCLVAPAFSFDGWTLA